MLCNMAPKELLRMRGTRDFCRENITCKCSVFEMDDWVYTADAAEERLLKQFLHIHVEGFRRGRPSRRRDCRREHPFIILTFTSHTRISHITAPEQNRQQEVHAPGPVHDTKSGAYRRHEAAREELLDVIDKTVPYGGAQIAPVDAPALLDVKR